MFEVEARNATDADDPAAILIPKCEMYPRPVRADVMEAFMVDLRDICIERNEFEIGQRYGPFWLLQPLRVRTLALFDKIGEGDKFSVDIVLAWEIVCGDKSRKLQEKLSAQGQRIYGSL